MDPKEDFSPQQINTLTTLMKQAAADEGRATREFVEQSIKAAESRIIGSVGELLNESILPQIDKVDERVDDHDRRLTKLEQKSA